MKNAPSLELCNEHFGKNSYVIERSEGEVENYYVKELTPKLRNTTFPLEATSSSEGLVEISITSEYPTKRKGETEYLCHEPEHMDLTRFADVGSVLLDHNRTAIIGKPEKVWLDNVSKKSKALIRFDEDAQSLLYKDKVVKYKSLRGVSGGILTKKWIWLRDKNTTFMERFHGPAFVGLENELIEASFTTTPLDPSVGVNRSEDSFATAPNDGTQSADKETAGEKMPANVGEKMPTGEIGKDATNDVASVIPAVVTPTETRSVDSAEKTDSKNIDMVKTERNRIKEIMSICKRYDMLDTANDFIERGSSDADVYKYVLDKNEKRTAPIGRSDISVIRDGCETFRSAAIDGLLLRGNVDIKKPTDGADTFRGMSLLRLAEECIRQRGIRITSNDPRSIVDMALRGSETITGSTTDFPYILSSTAYKSILSGWEVAPTSYQFWASVGSLNDFKPVNRIKFSEVGKLSKVDELGHYRHTAMAETHEAIQLGTYALAWTMSRQGVINDDQGAFTQVPRSMGMQARMLPNDLAIAVLQNNAEMSDGNALFSVAHANTSSETDRRLDTVAHAQTCFKYLTGLIAQQKTFNSKLEADGRRYLNLKPSVWLVSGADEMIARQAVYSPADAGSTYNPGIINPVSYMNIKVIADQNISTGPTDYSNYAFVDPRLAPVVEVAFLQGNQTPYFEQMDQTDVDGRKWLVRLDCGAAAVDWVGVAREVGTD